MLEFIIHGVTSITLEPIRSLNNCQVRDILIFTDRGEEVRIVTFADKHTSNLQVCEQAEKSA